MPRTTWWECTWSSVAKICSGRAHRPTCRDGARARGPQCFCGVPRLETGRLTPLGLTPPRRSTTAPVIASWGVADAQQSVDGRRSDAPSPFHKSLPFSAKNVIVSRSRSSPVAIVPLPGRPRRPTYRSPVGRVGARGGGGLTSARKDRSRLPGKQEAP